MDKSICTRCNVANVKLVPHGKTQLCKVCLEVVTKPKETEQKVNKVEWEEPSYIIDGIFLGGIASTGQLDKLTALSIKNILAVAENVFVLFPNKFFYLRLPLMDYLTQKLEPYLDTGYDFICKSRDQGQKILVHCVGGISRSASIVIYYMMKAYSVSFFIAFNYVKENRSCVLPNSSFRTCLKSFNKPTCHAAVDDYMEKPLNEIRKYNVDMYNSLQSGMEKYSPIQPNLKYIFRIKAINSSDTFQEPILLLINELVAKGEAEGSKLYVKCYKALITQLLSPTDCAVINIADSARYTITDLWKILVTAADELIKEGKVIKSIILQSNIPLVTGSLIAMHTLCQCEQIMHI